MSTPMSEHHLNTPSFQDADWEMVKREAGEENMDFVEVEVRSVDTLTSVISHKTTLSKHTSGAAQRVQTPGVLDQSKFLENQKPKNHFSEKSKNFFNVVW